MIRDLREDDIEKLRKIHEKYFKEEFEFPDFLHGYYCTFCVVDDNNNIITAGGVRPIAESVLITNMLKPVRERKEGLLEALQASLMTCKHYGFKQLHAFIKDDDWSKVLEKHNFKPVNGKALVLNF